ncbi:hypothetical protein [Nonomuraea typhae]|uniref:hypothetical protein n=1 Tax=Nonomuraea typhae TaxID=2603600 RepID=UPI0012FBCA13|nr:hypothetical protein [Nonomuraea typhae]
MSAPGDGAGGAVDVANGEVLAELAVQVERLASAVAELQGERGRRGGGRGGGAGESEPPRPWCWLRMDHAAKADHLAELADWVREVLFAWPEAQRAFLPCWTRHWDVIEELSALYGAWKTAYLWEGASSRDASEYLDRWLPGAIARASVRLRPCAQSHHPDGERRDDAKLVDRSLTDLRRLARR